MDFLIPNDFDDINQVNSTNDELDDSFSNKTFIEYYGFGEELANISKAFPTIDVDYIESLLGIYKDVNDGQRISYICSDLIKKIQNSSDVNQLLKDANIIRTLFPKVDGKVILTKLKVNSNNLGRIQTVIKEIIEEEKNVSVLNSTNNRISDSVLNEIDSEEPVLHDENIDLNVPTTSTDYRINVPLSHTVCDSTKDNFNNNVDLIENNNLSSPNYLTNGECKYEDTSENIVQSSENFVEDNMHNYEDSMNKNTYGYTMPKIENKYEDFFETSVDSSENKLDQVDTLNFNYHDAKFGGDSDMERNKLFQFIDTICDMERQQGTVKKRRSSEKRISKKLKTTNNNLDELITIMDSDGVENNWNKNGDIPKVYEFIDLATEEEETSSIPISNKEENLTDDKKKLYYKILEMFSDMDNNFLSDLCKKFHNDPKNLEPAIDYILTLPTYPKRNFNPEPEPENPYDPEVYLERLKQFLPEADPIYLMESLQNIKNQEQLENFVMTSLELRNYPTMKDYLRKQKLASQAKQYTTEFNVDQFLEVIPDPVNYFNSPDLKHLVISSRDKTFYQISNFLKNNFPQITIRTISTVLNNSKTFFDAVKKLENCPERMSVKRKTKYPIGELFNIPLLQAFAYVEHKTEILDVLGYNKDLNEYKRTLAKENGTMLTCSCCYDEEVLPEESINCPNNCIFCKNCLTKCVEIGFGEGKLDYPCLLNCGTKFSLQALKDSLPPKLFSKLAQKKQLEEVKAAGLEELEFCPFCDFGTIPAPGDKLFRCLNPECMKESCRQCKETSHIPLTCEEVEKDDDIKKRTYIENKMTEALLRTCYKCNIKFIKQDGCNKMTCPRCGSTMCYVCNKPVKDYKHFNGQGGDKLNLCPLYSDALEMHKLEVLKVAEAAKKELGVKDLKIDPLKDVAKHYDELKKKKPTVLPPGVHVNQQVIIDANLLARVRLNHP